MAEQANIPFGDSVCDLLELMNGISHGDKEVFLRELVRKATRALYGMRRETLYECHLIGPRGLFIDIIPDKSNHTLSIVDNGIGMNKNDLKKLFTIPEPILERHKQAARRLQNNSLAVDEFYKVDSVFHLGFFAAFMVADNVEITTNPYGTDDKPCRLFASARDMSFFIVGGGDQSLDTTISSTPRGTKVTLQLKEDQFEYLDVGRLKVLIDKYTFDLVPYPISVCSPYGDIIERRLADVEEKKKDINELKIEFEDLRKLFVKTLYGKRPDFKHAIISDRFYDLSTFLSLDMSTLEINPRHRAIKRLRQDHMKNPDDKDLLIRISAIYMCGVSLVFSYDKKHKTKNILSSSMMSPIFSDS